MPKVYNRAQVGSPKNTVFVGPGSDWECQFKVGKDGSHAEVERKYNDYVKTQPSLIEKIKQQLKGKSLVCLCSPSGCHANVLLRIANEDASLA